MNQYLNLTRNSFYQLNYSGLLSVNFLMPRERIELPCLRLQCNALTAKPPKLFYLKIPLAIFYMYFLYILLIIYILYILYYIIFINCIQVSLSLLMYFKLPFKKHILLKSNYSCSSCLSWHYYVPPATGTICW